MKRRFFAVLVIALLSASHMISTANAFDIIRDLPPISAKLSEGNQTVTITFETAPNPGEYITVYSVWDVYKINEPLVIRKITDHNLVQTVRLDKPVQDNVFVSYAPLHTSEGRQIESRVIESTGYMSPYQSDSGDSSYKELIADFENLPIYDVLRNTYMLGDDKNELTVLVIGRVSCGLTLGKLRSIKNLLDRLKVKDVGVYLLDMDNSREDVSIYAEQNPDIHTAWHNNSQDYDDLFWEIQKATSSVSDGRAVLPSLCILNRSLQPIYYGAGTGIDFSEIENVLSAYATQEERKPTGEERGQNSAAYPSIGEKNDSSNSYPQSGNIPQAEGGRSASSAISAKDTNVPVLDVSFLDVQPGTYYYDAVKWAVGENITTGTTASIFSPNNTCTQAQIITFLHRAMGEPTAILENPYSNSLITSGKYYYNAMLWAYQNDVVTDVDLNPDSNCTRADVVTYLWRLAGKPSAGSNPFTDVSASANYAEAVAWAVQQGITSGTSPTTFCPNNSCTRAQIVTFLYRNMV